MTTRTRAPGEGCVKDYETKQGVRWFWKAQVPDPISGEMKQKMKRGYASRTAAAKALREVLAAVDKGTYAEPSKTTFADYLAEWLDGLRLKPSTTASYRKNVRLHVNPYVGTVPLASLTGPKLTKLYRELETTGRRNGPGGLKPRTVRYVHTIVHHALKDAVNAGLLVVSPADKANPPTVAESKAPEMTVWTATEVRSFLSWCRSRKDPDFTAWVVAVITGVRRGELLALRWKDIDFEANRISVRRAMTLIKIHGAGEEIIESTPKSGRSRVVDLDVDTTKLLKQRRKTLAEEIGLTLASADALVFGTVDGTWRHPERFSRKWRETVAKYNAEHPGALLPKIHLHELRHTSATLLLAAGQHAKTVSERLGHATVSITLDVYSHAVPSLQREAATQIGTTIHGFAA